MQRIVLLLILFLLSLTGKAQQTYKVLFLGNSYTAANNLPLMAHDIAAALGDSLYYDSNTPGGYTLSAHCTNATTLSKIQSQAWDFVVLQEQSQLPSLSPALVATDCFPFATRLDSLIQVNDSCTETLFYMTWGRKNGDQVYCPTWPPVCTYDGMQARLRDSYLQMGVDNHATVAPVGMAWAAVRALNPSFDLWSADESHPSIYGSYLTACVFYSIMFHKSPEGCSFISTIPAPDALLLQQVAAATVFDSLDQWAGPGDKSYARFAYTANGLNVQFTDTSLHAATYSWDFGDGQTSSAQDPIHIFPAAGDYLVCLSVSNDCFTDTICDTIHLDLVSLPANGQHETAILQFYPNPSTGVFMLHGNDLPADGGLIISDGMGRKVCQLTLKEVRDNGVNLSGWPAGLYFCVFHSPDCLGRAILVKD